ncbi:MAG: hypothetical protein AAF800_10470 [Planctomycetota bacterium]
MAQDLTNPYRHRRARLARQYRSLVGRVAALFVLLWLTMLLSGCNVIAWGAQAARGEEDAPVPVAAQYTDLVDRRVAVMVSADEFTLFRFPRATSRVGQAVSNGIVANVEGAAVSLPSQVDEFQRGNPYWITTRPSRLIDRLGVDRLVVIDLHEYRTHEAGNANVWRGVVDATVSVYEADGEDPDNRTFEAQVRAEYPEGSQFGLVSQTADEAKIEAAVLRVFALRAGGLFYDHEDTPR